MTSPFRSDLLQGKVAFITGGGSGIGLGIAEALLQHGAKVAIMGRREQVLKDAVKALQNFGESAYFAGDVRKADDVTRAIQGTVDKFGQLNILVNSAAGNFLSPAEDLSPNGFRTVMEIDALGTFIASRAAFPHLKAAGGGSIVNISATLHYGCTPFQVHASAAKAAIDSMMRTMSVEWGEFGIRVNCIAPGPIADTPGYTKLGAGSKADREAYIKRAIPLGKVGVKSDIAYATIYLCAEQTGGFVSGAVLVVDGAACWNKPLPATREMIKAFSRQIEGKSRAVGTATSKL